MTDSEHIAHPARRAGRSEPSGQPDPAQMAERFSRRHFSLAGSLRLHRAAIGFDMLRAPANVILSPVLLLVRLLSWLCGRLGLRAAAGWLARRKQPFRTAVAARVETLVLAEVLGIPLAGDDHGGDREALTGSILAAPCLRDTIRRKASVAEAEAMAARILDALAEYSGTRSALAEFTTALVMLVTGAVVFQSLTPGAISMAPGVAEQVARTTALADFPLGSTLGAAWYGVFPVGPSPGLMLATVAGLVLLGALLATFAGVIADPVQVRLGIHQRRLVRLMATIDAEIRHMPERPFVAREHFLARVFDLWDAALALFKVFKG
jgi:hypothetical protein